MPQNAPCRMPCALAVLLSTVVCFAIGAIAEHAPEFVGIQFFLANETRRVEEVDTTGYHKWAKAEVVMKSRLSTVCETRSPVLVEVRGSGEGPAALYFRLAAGQSTEENAYVPTLNMNLTGDYEHIEDEVLNATYLYFGTSSLRVQAAARTSEHWIAVKFDNAAEAIGPMNVLHCLADAAGVPTSRARKAVFMPERFRPAICSTISFLGDSLTPDTEVQGACHHEASVLGVGATSRNAETTISFTLAHRDPAQLSTWLAALQRKELLLQAHGDIQMVHGSLSTIWTATDSNENVDPNATSPESIGHKFVLVLVGIFVLVSVVFVLGIAKKMGYAKRRKYEEKRIGGDAEHCTTSSVSRRASTLSGSS